MATQAKHAANGNGNGSTGGGVVGRLQRLLAENEETAAAIRKVIALFNGADTVKAKRNAPDVIAHALAIDSARRERKPRVSQVGTKIDRRRQARAAIAALDPAEPVSAEWLRAELGIKRVGKYVQHGYLKRKGDGYVPTAKARAAAEEQA